MSAPLFSLPSPFPGTSGIIHLLEPSTADRSTLRDRLLERRYDRPFLLEHDGSIGLHFSLDYVQSSMRHTAPDALELAYTRHMAAFVLFHTAARQIGLLGLGGGSLAKFCYRRLPEARLIAVESNPDVIAFRDAFRLPPDDARLTVTAADAATFIAAGKHQFDVLLVDAFDSSGIAASVREFDFYRNARRALARRGVLVANLSGEMAERAAHLELIRQAFGDNLLISPVEDGCNHIVFAFQDSRFEPRWKWIAAQAGSLKKHYAIELPAIADRLQQGWRHHPGQLTA